MLAAGFRTNKEYSSYIFDLKLAVAAHFGDLNSKEANQHNRKAERKEMHW
jgi:hypothetical protein